MTAVSEDFLMNKLLRLLKLAMGNTTNFEYKPKYNLGTCQLP